MVGDEVPHGAQVFSLYDRYHVVLTRDRVSAVYSAEQPRENRVGEPALGLRRTC